MEKGRKRYRKSKVAQARRERRSTSRKRPQKVFRSPIQRPCGCFEQKIMIQFRQKGTENSASNSPLLPEHTEGGLLTPEVR